MQQALICWPLRLQVLRAMVMLCPVCLCAMEDGRHGLPDLCVIEVWMSSWWNDQGHVRSGHGSHAPVDYAWSRLSYRRERVPRLGAPVAPRLA
jgi:hypothetical protein